MRIVVIPAYNAGRTIQNVVYECVRRSDKVIVVDNNCKDDTAFLAKRSGANVVKCTTQGAGAATKFGIAYALEFNPKVIVTIDSDGQHDPIEMDNVAVPVERNYVDVSIGSRILGAERMPKYRKVGNTVISMDFNYYSDSMVRDTQSCFRAFNARIARLVEITEDKFGFSTEFLVKARKLGARIKEVPIRCIYHDEFGKNSTMNPIKHGFSVLVKTEKWRLKEDLGTIIKRF